MNLEKTINNILLISICLTISACSSIKEPNYYSKKGYCVVTSTKQKAIGLNRFNTTNEFKKKCNSKMIFNFDKDECRLFTMKDMKFDIYIKDKNNDQLFKVGEEKMMCGKKIIEYIK